MKEQPRPATERRWCDSPTDDVTIGTQFRVVSTDGVHFAHLIKEVAAQVIPALLSECGELHVSVIMINDNTPDGYECVSGWARGMDGRHLVFCDDVRADLADAVSIEI